MSAAERPVQERLERASLYRLLGGALARPQGERLVELAEAAEALAPAVEPAVAEPLARFAAAARQADAAAIGDEYVFLFDRAAKVPPYEGAWGEAPQLAGKAALLADVAGFYAAFGLVPGGSQPDVEDHIAAECEFMSALALKEAYALAESDEEGVAITSAAQSRFVGDHLGRWSGTFAEALRDASPLPYYGALADLLGAWVTAEIERLGATPSVALGRSGYDPIQEADAFSCPMAEPEPAPEDAREEP
ncbi:MAG TPA: molecular chaperone TorD family protein [Candidatus Deferrimicrobiaceae bacterium]|nr:molecular chaperone TorD family protein [Candidatus Deferrimicrobiaceae bacterium]